MIAVKDRRELEEVAAEDHLSPGKISDRPCQQTQEGSARKD